MISALLCLFVGDILISDTFEPIGILGWTRGGQLLFEAKGQVYAWPGMSSVRFKPYEPHDRADSYPSTTSSRWIREPGRDRWANELGMVDGNTIRFRAHDSAFAKIVKDGAILFWRDGKVGCLMTDFEAEPQATTIYVGSSGTKLTTKWAEYYGVSPDGRFITATPKPLLADNDMDIVEWKGPGTQPTLRYRYRKACDDHAIPGAPLWNDRARKFLVNLSTPAYPYPYLAGRRLTSLRGNAIWGEASWLPDASSRYLLWLMEWRGDSSYDKNSKFPVRRALVTRLELRDAVTGKKKLLAESIQWRETRNYDAKEVELPGPGSIEGGELDFTGKRLAIVLRRQDRLRLVVRSVSAYPPHVR